MLIPRGVERRRLVCIADLCGERIDELAVGTTTPLNSHQPCDWSDEGASQSG